MCEINKHMKQQSTAISIVRIITGLLVAYHGLEVFDAAKMAEYATWDSMKVLPMPKAMAYVGKMAELLGGLALAAGLFTRWAAASIVAVMLFICFYLGKGKFWYDDQHAFLLALLSSIYLVGGAGK
ncbi:MAG: DoxX family membrane protein, partial [Bacteroidetes bacterium]